MPSRRVRPDRPPHVAEDDGGLLFPEHIAERDRAQELFGIDIEASLREWMELLAGDRSDALLRRTPRATPPGRTFATLDLSKRERQVVTLAAAGFGQRETGVLLGIGYETVRRHRQNAMRKLGALNSTHGVVLATLLGEIDFELLREFIFRTWDE